METQARRQEMLLSSNSPGNAAGLEAEEGVNDMLIGSIKAKLALLDSMV
jgi:hypothetical protein